MIQRAGVCAGEEVRLKLLRGDVKLQAAALPHKSDAGAVLLDMVLPPWASLPPWGFMDEPHRSLAQHRRIEQVPPYDCVDCPPRIASTAAP